MSIDTWSPSPAPATDAKPARPRWRRRLVIIFAAIAVLAASITTAAVLGVRHGVQIEDSYWSPRYKGAVAQVARWKSDSQKWEQTSDQWHSQLQELQKKVKATVGDLNTPHFVLWNRCNALHAGCPLTPGYEYVAGVPDTFTYFVSFRSTVPVTVWIMSSSNFVCWETHACPWHAWGWQKLTSLGGGVFHDAEGCAGYFAVFFSDQAGTLYPNVSIDRNPAPHPTGVCR